MTNPIISDLPERYKATTMSGSGGFSNVLICEDLHLKRLVAVKTIKDLSEIDRLKDEIAALMQLRSKHVVQIYDVLPTSSGSFGIVMEYVEGEDLFDYLQKTIKPLDILKILWQISSGISDIHSANIIHRDIKPNNMKIDAEGIIKIFDFGLARNDGPDAQTMGFKGSLAFSAPEQFFGPKVTFTNAIDVYAFGVMALLFVTKDLPKELQSVPPEPLPKDAYLGTFLEEYPQLIPIFEQCLDHDLTKRPSISSIKDAIAKYLLLDQHQALATHNENTHLLNKDARRVKLSLTNIGGFELYYNGLEFEMTKVSGEVLVNNITIKNDSILNGACVVSLGAPHRHNSERRFITFDISNPEVTL